MNPYQAYEGFLNRVPDEKARVEAEQEAWQMASDGKLLIAAGYMSRSFRGIMGQPSKPVDGDSVERWCQDQGIPIVEGLWWHPAGKVRMGFYLDPVDQDQEMIIKLRWL